MSMIFGVVTLSDSNIQRVLSEPPLIWRVLAPDDPDIYFECAPAPKVSFFSKLFGQAAPRELPEIELSSGEGESFDVDKAWHGIHYLLTKSDWGGEPPLDFIVKGGNEVGAIDVGYGVARAYSSQAVSSISKSLNAFSEDILRSRFDAADMLRLKIYPEIWARPQEQDDSCGYVIEYAKALFDFIRKTEKLNLGMVASIT